MIPQAELDPVVGEGCHPALPTGRFVSLPGRGRTYVRELPGPDNNSPVVMLLHGWTATAALNWHACFSPLAEHFRVIAPDHRGHGHGLRAEEPFRLEHCADDVAALARLLGISSFIAVGYSMGGCVAQLLWKRHRELVSGQVLCATSSTFNGTPRERVLFSVAAATSTLAGAVPLDRLTLAAVKAWSGWTKLRGRGWWGMDEVAGHDWRKIVEAGRQIGRFDSRSWITDVSVPTAVIAMCDDEVVPLQRQLALAESIPGATLWRIPGGHTACTVAPQRFVEELVAACSDVARISRRPATPANRASCGSRHERGSASGRGRFNGLRRPGSDRFGPGGDRSRAVVAGRDEGSEQR